MRVSLLEAVCVVAVFGAGLTQSAQGAIIVESRTGGQNFAAYSDSGAGFPNSWANSSAKSTAPDLSPVSIGSRFNSSSGVGGAATWFQVAPLLDLVGGSYYLEVTVTEDSGTLDVTSTVLVTNGTLSGTDDDLGTPGFQTRAFSNVAPANLTANTWNLVGIVTLDAGQSTPIVRFEETANVGASSRFYADGVRFTQVPEPASLGLLALASLGLFRGRRA